MFRMQICIFHFSEVVVYSSYTVQLIPAARSEMRAGDETYSTVAFLH